MKMETEVRGRLFDCLGVVCGVVMVKKLFQALSNFRY